MNLRNYIITYIVVTCILLVSCTSTSETKNSQSEGIEMETTLQSNFEDFLDGGPHLKRTSLADLSGSRWDSVFLFPVNMAFDDMVEIVGQPFELSGPAKKVLNLSGATILVFVDESGTVSGTIPITPPVFLSARHPGPYNYSGAAVEISTQDPGPYVSLELVNAEK